jgi:hypothetical protein
VEAALSQHSVLLPWGLASAAEHPKALIRRVPSPPSSVLTMMGIQGGSENGDPYGAWLDI